MYTRKYYVTDLLPRYQRMLDTFENGALGAGNLIRDVVDVCNSLNNILEYFVKENSDYLAAKHNIETLAQFKRMVYSPNHIIDGYDLHTDFYRYVGNIADSSKHLDIDRNNPKIQSYRSLREILAIIRYTDDKGHYYSQKKLVVATDDEGRDWPCDVLIYCSFVYITELLVDSKLIPSLPKMNLLRSYHISRSDSVLPEMTKLHGVAGEHFEMQLKDYIYEVNGPLQIRYVKEGEEFGCKIQTTFEVRESIFDL